MQSRLKTVRLAEICEKVQYGFTAKAVPQGQGRSAFVRGTDIGTNEVVWEGVPDCLLSDSDLEKYGLYAGDILITRMGTIGTSAVVGHLPRPAVFASYLIRHRVDKRIANPEYIGYILKSGMFRDFIASHGSGAVQPNINAKTLGEFSFPLPSLDEQQRVVSTLGVFDSRRRVLRSINSSLEAIARTLFRSWFVDFEPVRMRANGNEPHGVDPATAALFPSKFEDSELGPIPKGWHVSTIGSVLSVLETGRRPKGGVSGFIEGVPSIGAESIDGIGVFDFAKTKFVPTAFFESLRSGKPVGFEVLLYKDGGKPGEFKPRLAMFGDGFPFKQYALNEHVFMLRASSKLASQAFLYFWISQERQMDMLRHAGNKAAIPGINRRDVELLPVLVPKQDVISEFERVASHLIRRIMLNANMGKTLSDIRDTLLPRLISGEIHLSDAEAAVPASA